MTTAPAQHSALDARDDMLAIADTWPDLLDRLATSSSGPKNDRVSGTVPTGLVINETVSDVMGEVRAWAQFLTRVLMEETTWEPHDTGTDDLLRDIARHRIGHFTAHADEGLREAFHDDARHMRYKVEHAAYPSGKKRIPLHVHCCETTTTVLGARVPCPGQYTATLNPDMPGLIPDMICDHDPGHRITPVEWQRAARKSAFDPTAMRRMLGAITQGA
jgi:hypothetical protein